MQDFDSLRAYCVGKKGVEETMPFDDKTLVFKVMGKMFVLMDVEERPSSLNLKCNPERAIELRAQFPAIQPGYHMNKKHWNTMVCDNSLPDDLVYELIDHSYNLVVSGLKKTERAELENL